MQRSREVATRSQLEYLEDKLVKRLTLLETRSLDDDGADYDELVAKNHALEERQKESEVKLADLEARLEQSQRDILYLRQQASGPAMEKVLGIEEIFTAILGHLEYEDLLQVSHVSKATRESVWNTPHLRRHMWFDVPQRGRQDRNQIDGAESNPLINIRSAGKTGPLAQCAHKRHLANYQHVEYTITWANEDWEALFTINLYRPSCPDPAEVIERWIQALDCRIGDMYLSNPAPKTTLVTMRYKSKLWQTCNRGGKCYGSGTTTAHALVSHATLKQLFYVAKMLYVEDIQRDGEFRPDPSDNGTGLMDISMRRPSVGKLVSTDEDAEIATEVMLARVNYPVYITHYRRRRREDCLCESRL